MTYIASGTDATIRDIAIDLGVGGSDVAVLVTPLVREHGPAAIVREAKGMRDTVLTGFAVDLIRAALR